MSVILYTKPRCVQCDATKRLLVRENIPFQSVDLTEDQDAFEYVTKELGYNAAPVVVLDGGQMVSATDGGVMVHWSGFRPDLLAQLAVDN